ncbi:MAG: DUF3179 domain-containing protein [Actinobacteria bacterium]|nr:DUF3179 domain-containing protein [Actinomycetota bacterium]
MDPSRDSGAPERHPAFDKEAYDRYRFARKLGEAISGTDHPEMVPAERAGHMRPDDYVIGLAFGGGARAYPVWVVDNYHVVNDRVDDEPFFVVSCERCQSGSAFRSEVQGNPDREPLFRSVGFLNATLLLKDLRSGSHWLHYEGVGMDRRAAGVRLPWIATYHMEWADWLRLHPDTLVMVPPDDPTHPDARHGHGREELFARAGMDAAFLQTLQGNLDTTYPENEVVVGIDGETESVAFPLHEVRREGGVVADTIDGQPVVVFSGPGDDGFTMATYVPFAGDAALTFWREGGAFVDRQTGSRWTIEGRAVDGPLTGNVLEPVPWYSVRWHAWIYSHRDTRLFRSGREPVPFEEASEPLGPFQELLAALAGAGHEIRVAEPLVSQLRPREALASRTVYVDGDRLNLHAFGSEVAARDLHTFDASWSGYPLRARTHEGRTRRIGAVVIESDPPERFADPANVVPLPDAMIRWSKVLTAPALDALTETSSSGAPEQATPAFVDVVRAIRLSGCEVIDVGFLPPSQLRVGAVNGVALTIDAERFLLYRFETAELADAYATQEPHTIARGAFVLRSTPETMYQYQPAEVVYVGDPWIRWSVLLEDGRLHKALEGVIPAR